MKISKQLFLQGVLALADLTVDKNEVYAIEFDTDEEKIRLLDENNELLKEVDF